MPDFVLSYFADPLVWFIWALIAIDLVTGVVKAWANGTFNWELLARYTQSNVIPYVFGHLLIFAIGHVGVADIMDDPLYGVLTDKFGGLTIIASLLKSILDNILALTGSGRKATIPPETNDPPRNPSGEIA